MGTLPIDIDHVMCMVPDTEQARESFERLGFTMSPHSSIPDDGVGNRLVLFTPHGAGVANFIELMAIEDPTRLSPALAEVLSGGAGIKSLVNGLDDADATRGHHREVGLNVFPVWPRQRRWRLPSGEELTVSFRVLMPEPGQTQLMFNGVEHRTLGHYLRPEFRDHPNGARRWTMVTAAVRDDHLDALVELFERVYGRQAKRSDGMAIVAVRDTALRLVTPAALEQAYGQVDLSGFSPPQYCAITVEVGSLTVAARILATNGVRHEPQPDGILIDPNDACGMVVELVPASPSTSTIEA